MTLAEQIEALKLAPMTDEEIIRMAGLSKAQATALNYLATITADERAFLEQSRAIEHLAPLWAAGVEPYPSDVHVNRGRRKRVRA